MKAHLESLAAMVEKEIRTTGTILLQGRPQRRNSLSMPGDNPWKGLCRAAAEKLRELAPDLPITRRAIPLRVGRDPSIHVVAEVDAPDGRYIIDPTIAQYVRAPLVYGPGDVHPLLGRNPCWEMTRAYR